MFKYFQWQISRWLKPVELLFNHGNVRQLRRLASQFKEAGAKYDLPDFTRLGETLDKNAEKVVLRRIGLR
jgi:hypothetical protein